MWLAMRFSSHTLRVGVKKEGQGTFFTALEKRKNQCSHWMASLPAMEKYFQCGKHLTEKCLQTMFSWGMDYHLGASGKGLCRALMRRRLRERSVEKWLGNRVPPLHTPLPSVGTCIANTDSHRDAEWQQQGAPVIERLGTPSFILCRV